MACGPFKWQALDVVYLILDVAVVMGLALRRAFGVAAVYLAAISQILLYTLLRGWVTDVPEDFAVAEEQHAYFDGLVVFHVITIALVTCSLLWHRHRRQDS